MAVVEMALGLDLMAVFDLDNIHSGAPPLLATLGHSSYNLEEEDHIHLVVEAEAASACHPVVRRFVSSWFVFEAGAWACHQEELPLSSLFVSGLAVVQHRRYWKRLRLVDCLKNDRIRLIESHSDAPADSRPWSQGSKVLDVSYLSCCREVLRKPGSLLEVAEGLATTSSLEVDYHRWVKAGIFGYQSQFLLKTKPTAQ